MKKGCFIQSVIIATILVGAAVYIIKYKLNDWIVKPGKKLIISEVEKNWESEIAFIKKSVEKDSLKSLMNYYLHNIKTMEDVVNLDEDIFHIEFESIIKDSLVTQNELSKLTQILKKEENENSESN